MTTTPERASQFSLDVERHTVSSAIRSWVDRLRGGDPGALPAILGIVVLGLIFSQVSSAFLTSYNIGNLPGQGAYIAVIGLGLVFVLLLGEIDLSAGTTGGMAAGFAGRAVAGCGDGNNVLASWVQAAHRFRFALRVATPRGEWRLGSSPANAAGPDLRQLVLGSEGAFGVITAVTVRVRRLPEVTRLYLEVPGDQGPADWPHDRIRDEVGRRLGADLGGVELPEVDVLDLRTRVTTPMQHGRVFLVGDAAHLITPAGGKGMNLAIFDAVELAHGLVERFGPQGDPTRSERYSATRLRAIWRTQAFSDWFLRIMTAPPGAGDERDGFGLGLREGWVSSLQRDPLLRRWFAHSYAGVDPQDA